MLLFRAILFGVVILPAIASSQPCVDWSNSLDEPGVAPELTAGSILEWDEFVLLAGDSLRVCQLDGDDLLTIGHCPFPFAVRRIRDLAGSVVALGRYEGLARIDLTDPASPSCSVDSTYTGMVMDVVAIPAGLCVVSQEEIEIRDHDGAVLSTLETPWLFYGGTAAVVGDAVLIANPRMGGIYSVDVSDPLAPVLYGPVFCEDDVNYTEYFGVRDFAVVGDVLFASGHWYPGYGPYWSGLRHAYLQRIDVSDPLHPQVDICHEIPKEIMAITATEDFVAALSGAEVAFYSPDDLELMAGVGLGAGFGEASDLVRVDDVLVIGGSGAGVFTVRPDPLTSVLPLAFHGSKYVPSGGGRFGFAAWVEFSTFRQAVFDQEDPMTLKVLAAWDTGIGSDSSWYASLTAFSEPWAIVRTHHYHNDGYYEYTEEELTAVHLDGDAFDLGSTNAIANATLTGELCWCLFMRNQMPSKWKIFDMASAPVLLHEEEADRYGQLGSFGPYVLSVTSDQVDLYVFDDVAPQPIVLVDSVAHPQGALAVGAGAVVHDGLVMVPASEGVAIFSGTGDSEHPLMARGWVDLGADVGSIHPHGEYFAVSTSGGWFIVSVTDPDHPAVVASMPGRLASDFYWTENHLYVAVSGSMYLYDVADVSAPTYIGQSISGFFTNSSSGVRDQLLLNGGHVLPLDCTDVTVAVAMDENPLLVDASAPTATPNPFNPTTTISFDLARSQHASLAVHDLRGRRLVTLVDAVLPAGHHACNWTGRDHGGRALPSGTYLIRLRTGSAIRTSKAVLIR
jgi:hypothetical protein